MSVPLLLVLITVVPLVGVAVFAWSCRRTEAQRRPERHLRIRFRAHLDDHTRTRLRRLEERLARSQIGPCQQFGHALINGRCRRDGCTYTTQRSER